MRERRWVGAAAFGAAAFAFGCGKSTSTTADDGTGTDAAADVAAADATNADDGAPNAGDGSAAHDAAPNADATLDAADAAPNGDAAAPTCGGAACPPPLVCDHAVCLPAQPPCTTNADCKYDTYCDTTSTCTPFASAPDDRTSDPTCDLVTSPGAFAPKTKCAFVAPPAGDPFPNHVDVQATPMVADVGLGGTSIVVSFTAPVAGLYTENQGVLRFLSGADCTLQANAGGTDIDGDSVVDWTQSPSAVAIADLDGDHLPEVVVYMGDGSTAAFTTKNGVVAPLWPKGKATLADGTTVFLRSSPWGAPSVHDLDDDGFPEVIREGSVIDGRTGKLRTADPSGYVPHGLNDQPLYWGTPAALADLDGDGKVDLTNGAHLWSYDGASSTWTENATYGAVSTGPGWAAFADFDPSDGLHRPEIAVATTGLLGIYGLDHATFMGMSIAVPGGGGGPPTIADFDGDGLPEVGLAGADYYTVFDPDCQTTPRTGGACVDRTHCEFATGGACPPRVLWSRKTQDHTSNVTGSSVFDLDADGHPEVVYADECFARIYAGGDGRVLFSRYHSSCTWIENPVVADVDGDFRAELVLPSNTACGPIGVGVDCSGTLDTGGVDRSFPGQVCAVDADCASAHCDAGLCRCTRTADCCAAADDAACLELGTSCVAPPAGTAGTGSTCRAPHPHGVHGIRVLADAYDRWGRARRIWNQHAYAVTNVGDDGTVPSTSAWASNWTSPAENDFRRNAAGQADPAAVADLTARVASFGCASGDAGGDAGAGAQIAAPVCNRGAAPVGPGVAVGFYVAGARVCGATTATAIAPGACVDVACVWTTPPTSAAAAVDVEVRANDQNPQKECDVGNDVGVVLGVACP